MDRSKLILRSSEKEPKLSLKSDLGWYDENASLISLVEEALLLLCVEAMG